MNGSFFPNPSDFSPIPELASPNSDVFIFFLSSNGITSSLPIMDNWYNATRSIMKADPYPHGSGPDAMQEDPMYYQSESASPLACRQQLQFCNPNLPEEQRCAPLAGIFDFPDQAVSLFSDPEAIQRFMWTYNAAFNLNPSISTVVQTLGAQALSSRNSLEFGIQGSLPSNQWQIEVQHWHDTALASLQNLFVTAAATMASDPNLRPWLQTPVANVEKTLCRSQVSGVHLVRSLLVGTRTNNGPR
jgi:hypothetical protein